MRAMPRPQRPFRQERRLTGLSSLGASSSETQSNGASSVSAGQMVVNGEEKNGERFLCLKGRFGCVEKRFHLKGLLQRPVSSQHFGDIKKSQHADQIVASCDGNNFYAG